MSDKHGTVYWSELMTRDVPAALAYYKNICGWSFDEMPMEEGTYYIGMAHGKSTTGLMDMSGMEHLSGVPAHWFTYLAVDDVDAAVAQTRQLGGNIQREPFDLPGVGRIAIVMDPTGAAVGIMTPAAPEE